MAATTHLEASLARRRSLTDEERVVLRALPSERSTYAHGDLIVREGIAPEGSCLLVRGMAMRAHRIGRSERVVSALHVPGDFVDLHSFLLDHLDHDIVAVGPCTIDFVAAEHLEEITRDYPHLGRLLWLETLIDAKMHRMWVATRAALRGSQRVGHLICELHARLGMVGLVNGGGFEMPLDQRGLAEVLGYSVVHVNHAVRDLRAEGLLEWTGGRMRLPDPGGLAEFAGFDPAYLELTHPKG
ncbi:CRP-like cAMP-binding protein [Palleronia aestuarii]|uniref:CRP-like cAMP-binding protein n=1 Tax=Palleronia aestuarii TaxID=568105 RepID=A0A2W7N8Z0_9RHOB|nr:Crp/Fnr family transcriptional regulator [Palleronia aestuarii]PZX16500.1 CRP-like cAMP-binding protein [Palleronia aestuarii]